MKKLKCWRLNVALNKMNRKDCELRKIKDSIMYARLKKTVQLFICLYICRAATGKRQTEPFASIKIVELKERKQYKRSFFSDIA